MTEEEAKTKQCCGPLLIAQATLLASHKDAVTAGFSFNCIASGCEHDNPNLREGSHDRPGYCGLAGPP